MNTNWKRKVDDINSQRFVVPDGWDTKDEVAESLQCAPDKVRTLLKPGLDAGTFESKAFPVWDSARRMAVNVTCYRECVVDGKDDARVKRSIENNPGISDAKLSKNLGMKLGVVREIRGRLGI